MNGGQTVAVLKEAEIIFRIEIGESKLVLRHIPTDKISFLTLKSPKLEYFLIHFPALN